MLSDVKGINLVNILEYFVKFGQIRHVQPFEDLADPKKNADILRVRIFYENQESVKSILTSARHFFSDRPVRVLLSKPSIKSNPRKMLTEDEIESTVIKVSLEKVRFLKF